MAFHATNGKQSLPLMDEQVKRYEKEIERYQGEGSELQKKARGYEAQYDALNYSDDQFDLSDAALSVSIAMLAVTALTRKGWLLWLSLVIGAFVVVMGIAGIVGWRVHPDWIIKMLS